MNKTILAKKNLPMNGILNSTVRADVIIKNPANKGSLRKDTTRASIEGSISVAYLPKYRQAGESLVISKNDQYLVLIINKVNAFEAIADLGDPMVWVTIEWSGITRTSRLIRKPLLNETFYFKMNVNSSQLNGPKSELTELLTDELNTKPEVIVSVWADSNNGQVEFLGLQSVSLRKLGNTKFADRTFTD